MPALHYLTIQDMLWINHCVTGRVCTFRFDKLEEATFYQYGYGGSLDLEAQAVQFLEGFRKQAPFEEGNEASAFVGFVAFLRANGKDVKLSEKEAASWIESGVTAEAARAKIVEGEAVHGLPNMERIVEGIFADFGGTLKVPASKA